MAKAYSQGTWDSAITGGIASEITQEYSRNRSSASISYRGRNLSLMSMNTWQKSSSNAENARFESLKNMNANLKKKSLAGKEKAKAIMEPYLQRVKVQRDYKDTIPQLLRDANNEHDNWTTITGNKRYWKNAYEDIGHFLTSVLLAFEYQFDRRTGIGMGPGTGPYVDPDLKLQLDVPEDKTLQAYFKHKKHETTTDNELAYFESYIATQVRSILGIS
ncbi:hypothetical protein PG995_008465 [Apiospora arundinis]